MKVTEVKIFNVNKDNLKAFASITFDECFVVTGIKVLEGSKGLFIGMPSQKTSDGEYKDVVFPINKETRDFLSKVILDKYFEVCTPSSGMQA